MTNNYSKLQTFKDVQESKKKDQSSESRLSGAQLRLVENWYFVTKIVLTYHEKKTVPEIEKNF